MRTLSSTLLTAQKQASRQPFVEVKMTNRQMGVVRLDWTRLYTGTEPDGPHAVTMPGDGSLIRVRVTDAADGRKLYRQRVTAPESLSDYTQWTYTGSYSILAVALCSLGTEISLFWVDTGCKLQRQKSTDGGTNWSSPELLDYVTSTAVYGLAAAYKANGDIAVFITDQNTLFIKQYTAGEWQDKTSWDKTTGDLSGVTVIYDSDWNLLLSGLDVNDNPRLWSLIYGDGGNVTPGDWSGLNILASAPDGENFSYTHPFLDKPDVCRSFYVEKYTGVEAYNQPYRTYIIPESSFSDSLWHEPVPFYQTADYGLAMTHSASYVWLTCPSGVWRAPLATQTLDLADDVISIRSELEESSGKLAVELDNSSGKYAAPGNGALTLLQLGLRVDFKPGYRTTSGNEVSSGLSFTVEGYEHTVSGGKASLSLHAYDGWAALAKWRAHYQFRWNKESEEMNVKQILEFILARSGIKLEVKSASDTITDFYPDFTIRPGNFGDTVVNQLLGLVPDVIFIEGYKAYMVNPQSGDISVYSYGTDHDILEGKYSNSAMKLNRIQIEGQNAATGGPILVDSYNWDEINRSSERRHRLADPDINSVSQAQARGAAHLRKAELHTANDYIRIPVNCGQQMYDVPDVTDSLVGLSGAKRRVLGIILHYKPEYGEYEQKLLLGAV